MLLTNGGCPAGRRLEGATPAADGHGEGGGGASLKGGKGPGARAGGREEERGVRKNLGRELSSPEPALGVGMS